MSQLTEKTLQELIREEIARQSAEAKEEMRRQMQQQMQQMREDVRRIQHAAQQAIWDVAQQAALVELSTRRDDLWALLEARFGPLPREWTARIETTDNPERLKAAIVQVLKINGLDQLQL